MKNIQPLHLILGGCGLGILGILLPWYSATAKLNGTVLSSSSTSGTNFGLAIVALLLLAGAIATCYIKVPGKTKLIATCALGGVGFAALLILIEFIRILSNSQSVSEVAGAGVGVDVSAGTSIGVYLAILGALAGAYGCFLRWQKTPADPAPSAGPPSIPPAQPPGPPPA